MSSIKSLVENDLWEWIKNYIEVENKFYNFEFPVCPYAKAARLAGQVKVVAWESGSIKEFIRINALRVPSAPDHDINIMAMPPRSRWTWGIKSLIDDLNKTLIPQGYYVQYGTAVKTQSLYPGFFNQGRYFAVFVNKLKPVLAGHEALFKTNYYKPWSKEHYDAVVVRRQQLYEKYRK